MSASVRARGLAVLTYHGFSVARSVTTVEPSWFVETIERLLEAGFQGVDLGDWIARGRPDEPKGFALAFDDGLASILDVAPFVARRRLPATVFVIADRVGRDNDWPGQPPRIRRERLLDWSELRVLGRLGFRTGAHGASHAPLHRLSTSRRDAELGGSKEKIEQELGQACHLLAYPYGRNSPPIRLAASRIYAAAFGTRLGYSDRFQDRHDLHRIDAFYLKGEREIDAIITDRWRGGLAIRDRLRRCRCRVESIIPTGLGRS